MSPDDIAAALRGKAEDLQQALLAKVTDNLSGETLHERTGALKASIVSQIVFDGDMLSASVGSEGIAYAEIQEHGGTTSPHDIVPVKAQALAFAGAAGPTFARRVHHPGSRLPARPYLGSALDTLRDEISLGLKTAVLEALGAV